MPPLSAITYARAAHPPRVSPPYAPALPAAGVMPPQVYIIGGGETGAGVARELRRLGCTVTIADREASQVSQLRAEGLDATELDVINEGTLVSSGALGADLVVVATGKSVQAGIYATMLLKHLGAARVAACADTTKCADLLTRIGARVVFPKQQPRDQLASELYADLASR